MVKKTEKPQEHRENVTLKQEASSKAPEAPRNGVEETETGDSKAVLESAQLEELKAKISDLEASVVSYKDQFLRKAADFDNYRKRIENEIVNLTRYAKEGLITDLLPLLDDFERSLSISQDRKDFEVFHRGLELIYSKFLKVLEAEGVRPFDSLGEPFDVEYHDAVMQISKEGVPPNTVIEEIEKGYQHRDKVIRHAKVVVSKEPSESEEGKAPERVDRRTAGDKNTGAL